MRLRWLLLAALVSGCSSDARTPASADRRADRIQVSLWHCGVEKITVDDQRWEVPNDEETFDSTNAPEAFSGRGTIERVAPDELRYVDDAGAVLRFVPDDGTEHPCA